MKYKIFLIADKFDKNYKMAADEYIKRLSRFCKAGYEVVKDTGKLKNNRYGKAYRILVSLSGVGLSSEGLAEKINAYAVGSISEIWVFIGSDTEKLNRIFDFHESIRLSTMDMDAGLACAAFCEQLYRAYKILGNETYHR